MTFFHNVRKSTKELMVQEKYLMDSQSQETQQALKCSIYHFTQQKFQEPQGEALKNI